MLKLNEKELVKWDKKANGFMFQLMGEYPKGFTADEFYQLARQIKTPAHIIKRISGKIFKEFQASGYIKKTRQYRLSSRNGSSPLPVWVAAQEQVAKEREHIYEN